MFYLTFYVVIILKKKNNCEEKIQKCEIKCQLFFYVVIINSFPASVLVYRASAFKQQQQKNYSGFRALKD